MAFSNQLPSLSYQDLLDRRFDGDDREIPPPPPVDELSVTGSPRVASASIGPETHPPKKDLCPQCRGRKYGFTAYFHNDKIFSEPPHDLLGSIEDAYRSRDRLKSLLVTYTMREIEQDRLQEIRVEIINWGASAGDIASELQSTSVLLGIKNFNAQNFDNLKHWKDGMVDQLIRHVYGTTKMVMPSGRLADLMLEYRKMWERVWLGFLEDLKATPPNPLDFIRGIDYDVDF